jgi:putative polymerase
LTAESFWNTESTLFVSATRPDDRFFGFVNWHRMSSVFLEPVSLGNYCIFVVACLVAVPHLLKRWQILMLGAGTALMLVACDGRLATVTILFIAVFAVMAPRLPERVTLLLPLLIMFCASAFVVAFAVSAGSDTFPGRVAHTVHLLGRMSLVDWMGASDLLLPLAVDSGIAYLIITQSVAVTLLFWITFVMAADEADAPAARYKAGVAAYLALSMLVSFSFLSIKTAAPLWFVLGALQLARVHAPATASPVRLRRAVA